MKATHLAFTLALVAIEQVVCTILPETANYDSDISVYNLVIEEVVTNWKMQHPGISDADLSRISATANKLKDYIGLPPSAMNDSISYQSLPQALHSSDRRFSMVDNKTFSGNHSTISSNVAAARELVRAAQQEADERNRKRFANPRTNEYYNSFSHEKALLARSADASSLAINKTVAVAAALVAEVDAANSTTTIDYSQYTESSDRLAAFKNASVSQNPVEAFAKEKRTAASDYWMEHIPHVGRVPYGGSANNEYKVFRNVKDYGAKGDGKTDDTAAINKAMADGGRCGASCGSSTIKPALVYFPQGTYLVSSPIIMYYNTQMVGNAIGNPIIKAAKSFVGLGVVSSDVYTGNDGGADEWYINQNNFLRQLRNFIIDVSEADMKEVAGLHWQVAQATSITDVWFKGSKAADKNHIGIFAENGSGGFMSRLHFVDGGVGIRCGNQQFTTRGLNFVGSRIAIDLLWDWGWTWKDINVLDAAVAFQMSGSYRGGSVLMQNSMLANVTAGFLITTKKGSTESEKFSMTLDHIDLHQVGTAVLHSSTGTVLAGGTRTIDSWTLGKVYDQDHPTGTWLNGDRLSAIHPNTQSLAASGRGYFVRDKPNYLNVAASQFLNARQLAKDNAFLSRDGITDDTFALQLLLQIASTSGRILYIPMGSYIVTSTIKIPSGTRVVGECWSQIVAKGSYFEDMNSPQVVVKVGEMGDQGSVEIQDLLFTVEGATAGAILMEWNIAEDAQGSSGMWDTHFRVGGAAGSHLQASQCPKLTGAVNPKCIAGTMMLHMTAQSSGYLENVWAWVADHDLDSGPSQTQIDIYVGRGILIESIDGPVWLYGTSSEHAVLYQYMVYGASNVVMSMIQTESPYFFPKPQAPAPFTKQIGYYSGDPDFSECHASATHCAASWGLSIIGATNIQVFGAGMYNWFQDYTQPCVDTQDCQQRVLNVQKSGNVWLYNIYTIGTVEMVNSGDSKPILAKSNTNTNEHPFTSIINAWLMASSGSGDGGYIPEDRSDEDDFGSLPDCNRKHGTLDDLLQHQADIPGNCVDKYLSEALVQTLGNTLVDYDTIIGDGYDDKFKIYSDNLRQLAPMQVLAYMETAQASGIWKCTREGMKTCCNMCSSQHITCDIHCDSAKDCKPGPIDVTVNCPDYIEEPTLAGFGSVEVYTYHLLDKEKFFSVLSDKYGISREWITFGDRFAMLANGCQYAGEQSQQCIREHSTYWHNFPLVNNFTVLNPKDVVSEARQNAIMLKDESSDALKWAEYFVETSYADLTDSLVLPALMLQQAVSEMRQVVKTANQIKKDEQKQAIAGFITGILFMIPIAGEVAGVIGGTVFRLAVNLAGELGNIAYTIYDSIENPSSAVANVLSLLLGGTDVRPFKEAATRYRGISKDSTDKLGKRFNVEYDKFEKIRNRCVR